MWSNLVGNPKVGTTPFFRKKDKHTTGRFENRKLKKIVGFQLKTTN